MYIKKNLVTHSEHKIEHYFNMLPVELSESRELSDRP